MNAISEPNRGNGILEILNILRSFTFSETKEV